jgi:aryl-alcohol dehydrogenase-like predicted oxidoreductase
MTVTGHRLGKSGLKVSTIGLGCMGMSEFYDPKHLNGEESVRVIHRYLDAGGNFLDTADAYGVGRNESLVGKAIAGAATAWCDVQSFLRQSPQRPSYSMTFD